MTDYQLWQGNCLEEMDRIEDRSIDCILADLPYGTTACKWDVVIPFEPLWKQYKRVIKKNGAIVLFGDEPFTSLLILSNPQWFKYKWVWDKKKASGFLNAKKMPLKRSEDVVIFSNSLTTYNPQMRQRDRIRIDKARDKIYGLNDSSYGKRFSPGGTYTHYYPDNIIQFHNANQVEKVHPTQKPVTLLTYLIKTYSNEGDTILDNTCGSGSTLEAAMRCNRPSIGIEKNAGYYQIAKDRLERVRAELQGDLNHLPMFEGI